MKKFLCLVFVLLVSSQASFAEEQVKCGGPPELIKKSAVLTKHVEESIENEIIVEPEQKPGMALDATTKKQGEFFQVVIRGIKDEPKLWFNSKEYPLFEIPDNQSWNFIIGSKKSHIYRALVPVENMTKPGAYSILARTKDWEERQAVTIVDNNKPISRITLSSSKSQIYATPKELNTVGSGLKTKTHKKLWEGKFVYPSAAPKSSPFGVKRSYNGGPVDSYHKGLDFAAEKGATVVAPSDAKVVAVGRAEDGFNVHGNTVILDHGHGVTSIYMHLSKINVTKAQDVKAGEKIGEVGHTGISTGPHLHWGVYLSGTSIDPEIFVNNNIL